MFGDNCHQLCDCERESSCHPVTGKCLCPPGKTGGRCDAGMNQSTFGCLSDSWVMWKYVDIFILRALPKEHCLTTACYLALLWLIRVCSCYFIDTQNQHHNRQSIPCKYFKVMQLNIRIFFSIKAFPRILNRVPCTTGPYCFFILYITVVQLDFCDLLPPRL